MATRSCWRKRPSEAAGRSAVLLMRGVILLLACFLTSTDAAMGEPASGPDKGPTSKPATREATTAKTQPDEVAALIAKIKTGTPAEQGAAARRIGRLVLNQAISKDDPQALSALEGLLLQGLGDASHEAMWALNWMGPAALPSALKAVKSDKPVSRHYGAHLIGLLAKEYPGHKKLFKPALDELGKHLQDEDLQVRQAAIDALEGRGTDDLEETGRLLTKAVGGEWKVAQGGLRSLEGTVTDASDANVVYRFEVYPIPYDMAARKEIARLKNPIHRWPLVVAAGGKYTLLRTSRTPSSQEDIDKPCAAQELIIRTLGLTKIQALPVQMAGDVPMGMPPPLLPPATSLADLAKAVASVAREIDSNDIDTVYVGIFHADALVRPNGGDPNTSVFLPLVTPLFRCANYGGIGTEFWRLAANVLVRIGNPALRVLESGIKSEDSHYRWSAMDIMSRIGKPKELVFSSARSLLKDRDLYVRKVAAMALDRLGKDAATALPDLEKLLEENITPDDYGLMGSCRDAIEKIKEASSQQAGVSTQPGVR